MKTHRVILVSVVSLFGACLAPAAIVLQSVSRGWMSSVPEAPDVIDTYYNNYFTGYATATPAEYRSFFIFDFSSLAEPVASATLSIYQPPNGYWGGDSEEITFYDVSDSTIQALRAGMIGLPGLFDDLGTGMPYGSYSVTPSQSGTFLHFRLGDRFIEAADSTSGLLALGGRLTLTLPDADEYIFGYSATWQPEDGLAYLTLETGGGVIPEPSAYGVVGVLTLLAAAAWQRRRS